MIICEVSVLERAIYLTLANAKIRESGVSKCKLASSLAVQLASYCSQLAQLALENIIDLYLTVVG